MMAFVSLIGHQSKKIAFDLGLTSVGRRSKDLLHETNLQ
jgi:hypothetical protein